MAQTEFTDVTVAPSWAADIPEGKMIISIRFDVEHPPADADEIFDLPEYKSYLASRLVGYTENPGEIGRLFDQMVNEIIVPARLLPATYNPWLGPVCLFSLLPSEELGGWRFCATRPRHLLCHAADIVF